MFENLEAVLEDYQIRLVEEVKNCGCAIRGRVAHKGEDEMCIDGIVLLRLDYIGGSVVSEVSVLWEEI